jgi:hypothetical protein
MNPIIGALMIFSAILLAFFGIPISVLFLANMILPPNLEPSSEYLKDYSIDHPIPEPLGVPITVKKIKHNGNYVWVDA